ncbi:hypothetical protein [Bacillus sp. MUM 13]|uniref:hypothetical protein n=1 Tax=Bacillus sp. MUM 13 TaxID=1678001 RepID=UPI0008F5B745|nr:hypothetical protein [Bacillus sp. MUM 13]OIK14439.1 hypothetical protein BIV59_03140 [Bacillus sp. MUM 13]
MQTLLPIILYLIGLFILYLVIKTAVKEGINQSIVGKHLEKKYEHTEAKKSFFDSDLDNDR